MITPKSEFKITIPKWQNRLKVGAVIAKYYSAKDDLPKKYEGAKLKRFGGKFLYTDDKGKRIIKNPGTKGNPIYWTMNGQGFYNNTVHWSIRSRVVKHYHRYFQKYIKEQLKEPIPTFLSYKLTMNIDIYEVFDSTTPDISNMWILPKMFEDSLVGTGLLRDDSPEFRRKTSYDYIFVEKEEDRRLEITMKYAKY